MTISRTSLVNVSLIYHRENRRVRHTHTQSFVLCNVDQGARKEVGTTHKILCTSRGSSTYWIGSLRAGPYVLIPFSTSFWAEENQSVQDYTLVIHSKVQIDLQVINEPATLLADCLIATMLERSTAISQVCLSVYKTICMMRFICLGTWSQVLRLITGIRFHCIYRGKPLAHELPQPEHRHGWQRAYSSYASIVDHPRFDPASPSTDSLSCRMGQWIRAIGENGLLLSNSIDKGRDSVTTASLSQSKRFSFVQAILNCSHHQKFLFFLLILLCSRWVSVFLSLCIFLHSQYILNVFS